jgi:hypothetical protein
MVSGFAPAGAGPAMVLPADLSEAADLVRPVLENGGEPIAAIVLIEIEAQGVEG